MVVLQLLFQKTKLGLGLRAVADNPRSAALSGIRVGRMLMVGWGLAAALGTIAGVLLAAKAQLNPGNFDAILVYALAAIIIGGLDSPIGAVVAALGIAVLENLAGTYVPWIGHDLKIAVPFVFLFVILILRPQGLFGRKVVVRV
jgi:branched-chain amino acid transport system permease protein